jgi:para-nitrobenzyl esterase
MLLRAPRLPIIACFLGIAIAGPTRAAIEIAEVTGGRIHGTSNDGIAVFKGIPFAAPPVGKLRWVAPQPVRNWQGERGADSFAPACVQSWWEKPNPSSEDCLYLNVWTAAAAVGEHRPVMVWIHGGGYTGGMSWEKTSDGTLLARAGVVVVTIAYRLGALGFLVHQQLRREAGGLSGNYGLEDMVAALHWVQVNIARFGGDPARVTVAGGSAGAHAISLLAASQEAKGLFHRAIALGSAAFFPEHETDFENGEPLLPSLTQANEWGKAFVASLHAADIAAARRISSEAILQATRPAKHRFVPVIDGKLVRDSNLALYRHGQFNDTPILIGFTSAEFGDAPPEVSAAWIDERISEQLRCPDSRQVVANLFPHATDQQARDIYRYLMRDATIGWSVWSWAHEQSERGRNPAFVYFFDVHGPEHPFGAWHASEYPYFFGNLPPQKSPADEAASALIRSYFVNFARDGDPNGSGLPHWPDFSADSQMAMVFAAKSAAQPFPDARQIQALDALRRCGN